VQKKFKTSLDRYNAYRTMAGMYRKAIILQITPGKVRGETPNK
jgi:hypothetical protein